MKIRLAVRDWDWLTPLLLGDVKAQGLDLELDRVAALPDPKDAASAGYDGLEMSMSRYCLGVAAGERPMVGVPHFLMRAFRHRCIVVARPSPLTRIADLAGKTIGLAGWQDSGNTWTRALLRREGIGIEDARWRVSRLLASHPVTDRIGRYGRPGLIETVPGDRPLLEMLAAGELDAVFMPFMPADFYRPGAPFRQLTPDFREVELSYFRAVGYVPGIHLLGLRPELVARQPDAPARVGAALDAAWRMWMDKRLRYAETTPWMLDEMRRVETDLPATWNDNGLPANRAMIADFCKELKAQSLTNADLTPELLYPDYA